MATVSRENIGLLNDKITVSLVKDDYLPAFEQSIKNYAKKANIPGFRKGMVPSGMIKKMYGSSVFTEEVLKRVEKELNEYMSTEQPDIFAQPLPVDTDARQLDMNNPADYTFAFEIGLKTPININVNDIVVTRNKVIVTDDMVNAEIEDIRKRHITKEPGDEINSEENELTLELLETDLEGNELADGLLKALTRPVKSFAEGYRGELIGKKKDDTLFLQLSRAFDDEEKDKILVELGLKKEEEIADENYFRATIKEILHTETPELNEDLFKKVYPGKNLVNEDDFRNQVKEDLQFHWDAQSRNQLHDQLYHKLLDDTHVEFPENFLKKWLQHGGKEPKTFQEAEEELPEFIDSLKWPLITNQLSAQNGIKVEPHEIKDFAKNQLLGYLGGQAMGNDQWIDSYAENMMKDKKFVDNTYYQIQISKLFEALESQVRIEEQIVAPEELTAMQHHHGH